MMRLSQPLKELVELVADLALALGVCPGRSTLVESLSRASTPLLAQLAKAGQVDHFALYGGDVDLEVAGVDDHADGRA